MAMAYPDPELAGGGVRLRPWTMDDVDELVRCCNDEQVRRFLPPIPIPYIRDDAVAFVELGDERLESDAMGLAVVDGTTGVLRGSIGLRLVGEGVAQTGYWVAPEARGQGVASAALRLISDWALPAHELHRLQLYTDTENPASMRVAERAGFTREGTLRNWYEIRGERRDAVMFSRLPGDRT
jgi:[ribosomal protein S5]-alanine N-acetyltransferase